METTCKEFLKKHTEEQEPVTKLTDQQKAINCKQMQRMDAICIIKRTPDLRNMKEGNIMWAQTAAERVQEMLVSQYEELQNNNPKEQDVDTKKNIKELETQIEAIVAIAQELMRLGIIVMACKEREPKSKECVNINTMLRCNEMANDKCTKCDEPVCAQCKTYCCHKTYNEQCECGLCRARTKTEKTVSWSKYEEYMPHSEHIDNNIFKNWCHKCTQTSAELRKEMIKPLKTKDIMNRLNEI